MALAIASAPLALVPARAAPTPAPSSAPPEQAAPARAGSASSDLLVVLDADGRSYLAQHTLASEGALVVLALPGSVDAEHVRFTGSRRDLFDAAYRRSPGRLSLWAGSAFARYRHRHPEEAVTERDGVFTLTVPSVPPLLSVEDGELAHSAITWALPEGFELVSLGEVAPARGTWHREVRGARFEQRGLVPIELTLTYRRLPTGPDPIACLDGSAAESDACSPDRDRDGVPDRRDVCLPDEPLAGDGSPAPDVAAGPPASAAGATSVGRTGGGDTGGGERLAGKTSVDAFGCLRAGSAAGYLREPDGALDPVLVLDGIVFRNGQSYLDLDARRLLDRLALALARFGEDSVHEVVAHTDGAGSARRNRQLSMERARAVRHYLMLRGIGPNRLQASGAGEAFPLGDEASAAGRRANRRIELRRLDAGAAPSGALPAQ